MLGFKEKEIVCAFIDENKNISFSDEDHEWLDKILNYDCETEKYTVHHSYSLNEKVGPGTLFIKIGDNVVLFTKMDLVWAFGMKTYREFFIKGAKNGCKF